MIQYNQISDTPISYIAHEKNNAARFRITTCFLSYVSPERDFGILGFWKMIFIKIDI